MAAQNVLTQEQKERMEKNKKNNTVRAWRVNA